jgi:SAM-dependent methyltransferase
MLEAIVIGLAILFMPMIGPWWALAAIAIVLPGIIATKSGAPFVPSNRTSMNAMIELADIKPGELVYDLGCGEGRLLRAAARKGARAIGYELSIPTYLVASLLCLGNPRIRIYPLNFWTRPLHDWDKEADVVFCYLLPVTMQRFEREIWPKLKPGTRVVSHAFEMNNMKPEQGRDGAYLYRK